MVSKHVENFKHVVIISADRGRRKRERKRERSDPQPFDLTTGQDLLGQTFTRCTSSTLDARGFFELHLCHPARRAELPHSVFRHAPPVFAEGNVFENTFCPANTPLATRLHLRIVPHGCWCGLLNTRRRSVVVCITPRTLRTMPGSQSGQRSLAASRAGQYRFRRGENPKSVGGRPCSSPKTC